MEQWQGWLMALAGGNLAVWAGLLLGRGRFWLAEPVLDPDGSGRVGEHWPTLCAVIPARDEADVLPETLPALLTQDYPGRLHIVLVDDRSEDGTGDLAESLAREYGQTARLTVIRGEALPPGWSGKLWAVAQGIAAGERFAPDYWLLTDADICHHPENLATLTSKAESQRYALVSQMVHLRCRSFWEVLLIPAFVFFFQKLYPFVWVNDPYHPMAAAAGGSILVRGDALKAAGGIAAVRGKLIDDCSLAAAVKRSGGRLWLSHSRLTRSLRPYPALADIWKMVARTAFSQLDYSPWLLAGTVIGMAFLYLLPPLFALAGIATGLLPLAALGGTGWLVQAIAYLPTLRLYGQPLWLAPLLPGIALLYTAMTIDSALRHWRGEGGAWKGRTYATPPRP